MFEEHVYLDSNRRCRVAAAPQTLPTYVFYISTYPPQKKLKPTASSTACMLDACRGGDVRVLAVVVVVVVVVTVIVVVVLW